jgi:hypothetical protein
MYVHTDPHTGCPSVPGYDLTIGVDHFGDDIDCRLTDAATSAAARCNGDSTCKSFNTYMDRGTAWACTKNVSGPTSPIAGICFYTRKVAGE